MNENTKNAHRKKGYKAAKVLMWVGIIIAALYFVYFILMMIESV